MFLNYFTIDKMQPMVSLAWALVMMTIAQSPSVAQLSNQQNPLPANSQSNYEQIEEPYILGAGDRIRIDILGLPDYSGTYSIPLDGTLNLALIGPVSLQGLTLQQSTELLTNRYLKVLKRPVITVNLISPRALSIWVLGEVSRPGSYSFALTLGGGNDPSIQYPTIAQVIQIAGGISLVADARRIQIRRPQLNRLDKIFTIDLLEPIQTGNLNQNFRIRDGDTIFIPPGKEANVQESRILSTANFATESARPLSILISGEVNRPGSYLVTGGGVGSDGKGRLPTATQAIQQAGGITQFADIRRIQIRRVTRSGAAQVMNVNLWQLLRMGDLNQDVVLQDGDTILIPPAKEISPAEAMELANTSFTPTNMQIYVMGELGKPLLQSSFSVPLNTPLNQVLLAAGGFNFARSKRDSIELIRLNRDGTVTKRTINIDLSQGINEKNNPILRNNDVIIVGRNSLARNYDTFQQLGAITGNIQNTIGLPLGVLKSISDLINFLR